MFDKDFNGLEKLALWTLVKELADEKIKEMTKSVEVKKV
jgi:hypothetical protein